jgi:hypothetical protein
MVAKSINWIERLGKWRTVFAGWQLGTRPKGDPECDAVRDHREATMALRAECNALTGLMVERGIFTAQEFHDRFQSECQHLCGEYEKRFPGFKATDYGLEINPTIARDTMAGWRP